MQRLRYRLGYVMLWFACVGLLVPQVAVASTPGSGPAGVRDATRSQLPIVDAALSPDHRLRGQLVDRDGTPKRNARISLTRNGCVVAQAVTDDQGFFALDVHEGGLYLLSDGQTGALVRVWTCQAAPPSAKPGVLLVSDQHVARGAMGNGGPGNVIGWAAVIGVVTAVVVAAIDADDGS